jgi:hypothetical protein
MIEDEREDRGLCCRLCCSMVISNWLLLDNLHNLRGFYAFTPLLLASSCSAFALLCSRYFAGGCLYTC